MSNKKQFDNKLIKAIKANSNKNYSFIEEVANALDIGYDAAYRRINGKATISLYETVKLAEYFKISLGDLFDINKKESFVVSKTTEILNGQHLEQYFLNLSKTLEYLSSKNGSMLYSAKDLPIFYFLRDNLLSRFKIFVWLYVLDVNFKFKKIRFDQFKIPASLLKTAMNTGSLFENIKITEVWNQGIIDSTINQIIYFFEMKLLNYNDAILICKDLKKVIESIEENSCRGFRNDVEYKLYYNELLILNNNVLVKYKHKMNLYSPYSLLRYYLVEDQETCSKFEKFMYDQLTFSKLLSQAGVKDNSIFFNHLYKKIDKLKRRIELIREFPIN